MRASLALLGILVAMLACGDALAQGTAQRDSFFETRIRPLLQKQCVPCHGPGGQSAGVRLDRALSPERVKQALAAVDGSGRVAMPPTGGLPEADRTLLVGWLKSGGHFPVPKQVADPTWAFQPLRRASVPAVKGARNAIDAFLLRAMGKQGLVPSRPADKRTLLRRLTFDLTGLPPTPAQVDAFVSDRSPEAYEKVVDRLLQSPAYGERWGRLWLDVARYADTHGYDKDKRRDTAWRYRDWVIRAFNSDLPWNQFVSMQVAGDVLSGGTEDGITATGFLSAGPWDFVGQVELADGTVEKQKTRVLDRDDYVSASIGAFNSITVHCARCHDHKFDPVPQRDYYRLQAVFAGIERGDRLVSEGTGRTTSGSPTNGWHGPISATPDVTQWVQVDLPTEVSAESIVIIPARPTDFTDTPGFGFPVRWKVEVASGPEFADPKAVEDRTGSVASAQGDEAVVVAVNGRRFRSVRITATRLWRRTNDYVFALGELQVFVGGRNVARGASVSSSGSIEQGRWSRQALVDGFDSRGPLGASGYAVIPVPPRPIQVLVRGEVTLPGEAVSAGSLSCVDGLSGDFGLPVDASEGERRAALARWLVDRRNVLTWRSVVNRVWAGHFGIGLVDTPNDFGAQGGRPSHPDLLDWLAAWFRDSGQSLKALHRLIVLTDAYRQSSEPSAASLRADASNRLLSHYPRRRLDAEQIRDAVLLASGTLRNIGGGAGFDLFRYKDDHSPVYDHDAPGVSTSPTTFRRSVYRFVVRSVPNPFLDAFDAPDPNQSVPVRNTTLTALQALTLMNDAFVLDQSSRFAQGVQAATKDVPKQVALVFRRALGRSPNALESEEALGYVKQKGLAALTRLLFNTNEFQFID